MTARRRRPLRPTVCGWDSPPAPSTPGGGGSPATRTCLAARLPPRVSALGAGRAPVLGFDVPDPLRELPAITRRIVGDVLPQTPRLVLGFGDDCRACRFRVREVGV